VTADHTTPLIWTVGNTSLLTVAGGFEPAAGLVSAEAVTGAITDVTSAPAAISARARLHLVAQDYVGRI
jgi:hypothetical protein